MTAVYCMRGNVLGAGDLEKNNVLVLMELSFWWQVSKANNINSGNDKYHEKNWDKYQEVQIRTRERGQVKCVGTTLDKGVIEGTLVVVC